MSLRIYDKFFKKNKKNDALPPLYNGSAKQWLVVSLMALILWVLSCQRGYCQIATSNPGEYTILATGNALINNTVKSETKAERETALMQNAMAGEFTKMAEWERQYNSYLKMANGYASAIKAATHIYDDGVRILLTLNKLRQAASMAVCKINIDSDIRLAMTAGIRRTLSNDPSVFDPRTYLSVARDEVKKMVKHKIDQVLGSANKA